jgi:hypothetical protein
MKQPQRLDFLRGNGVEFLISLTRADWSETERFGPFPLPSDRPVYLYRLKGVVPPAQWVAHFQVLRSESIQKMLYPPGNPDDPFLATPGTPGGGSPGGAAQVSRWSSDRVELHVSAPKAGALVLRDTWYPGWRVWVDGREEQPCIAEFYYRGVVLPAGRHQVVWEYRPPLLRLAWWCSALGLLATAILLVFGRPHGLTGNSSGLS